MSTAPSPSIADYQRLRIRFRKHGDLRWISHRDLVRAMERLCRRADLALRMSEGFHPKPKLSFPSALALGIEGLNEVMELELVRPVHAEAIRQRLNSLAPAGLTITQIAVVAGGEVATGAVATSRSKARVRAMWYQFPVPNERRQRVEQAIERLMGSSSWLVERAGRPQPVNMMADLMAVEWRDAMVCFRLRASDQASARPRDVLQALGLTDLEQQGHFLSRFEVELET